MNRTLLVLALLVLMATPVWAQEAAPIFNYDPTVCETENAGDPLSGRCSLMIEAYPRPTNVEPIQLDTSTMGQYSFWRIGPEATTLYSGPGGAPVGEYPAGFNFINAIDTSNSEWLQIEGGQWIPRAVASYTAPSNFTGVEITGDLEYPFAWVLDLSRIAVSRYPGGPRDNEYGRFLERYERVNIFATALDDEGWRWYMIGPNEWVKQTFVSKVQKIEKPEGVSGRWIAVDLYEQTLVAYEDDIPVYATLISSGLPGTETREGVHEVWADLPVDPMSGATGAPRAYALQSVPWVMYFDQDISLHGTYWHDYFGYRQSRGCVNLTISDARWVFDWMHDGDIQANDALGTQVYVHSSGVYGEPAGAPVEEQAST